LAFLSLRQWLASPEGRASVFYVVLFMAVGVGGPFLPIWLTEKGISESAIGTVSATPILIMIVLSVAVGRIADRAKDWRNVIIAGTVIAGIAPIALLFVDGYWGILVVWTLMTVPFMAVAPVVDAATLRMTRRHGTEFGRVRVWGAIGFVIGIVIAGFLLGRYGALVFAPMIVAVGLIRAGFAFQLPYFREENEAQNQAPTLQIPVSVPGHTTAPSREHEPRPGVATTLSQTWQPWYILPLIGVAILQGSHMVQFGFGALIWARAGIPPEIIGPLWAVSPLSEIVIMLAFARVARRFSARQLLLASCAAAIVRWCGFALQPPVWGLAMLQALNMVTMGMSYLGVVNFIANWTTEDIAAQSQSVAVVFRQIASVAVLTGAGFLVARFGAGAFWASGALAFVAGLCVAASMFLRPPAREGALAPTAPVSRPGE